MLLSHTAHNEQHSNFTMDKLFLPLHYIKYNEEYKHTV